ncbi:reverse transcriptase [Elysia marginata]|uniref:Reverse transcriptase n=1 Tax=Elysia marginata TaxID=1093978 RepID=A0AAV4J7U9_9GAST|nr:reverse transcriptase [Elysia marginata]
MACATQLLSSEAEVVAQIARYGGLYSFRHHSTRANIWTRARHSATRLHCRIDATSDTPTITAEDVSSVPAKVVKSLRLVSRQRWTAKLLNALVQGRVARGLNLDKSTKDIARLEPSRSSLSFNAWSYWAKLRTNGLAVRGAPGSTAPDKLCRRCRLSTETTSHMISACPVHLSEMTGRHDRVQTILMDLLWDLGIEAVPNARPAEDDRAVPDVTITRELTPVYIDVTVPFDEPANCTARARRRGTSTAIWGPSFHLWSVPWDPGSQRTMPSGHY